MIALSTAWNADRWEDGQKIVEEIDRLGVKKIELNFSLTQTMVEEIFKYCKQEDIEIASLHNYCPIPEELKRQDALPDSFSLSSVDESERKKALDYTKITISTAKRLSAHAVVLHCGRVEIEDRTRRLIDLFNSGLKDSREYKEILAGFVRERELKKSDYFAQILKSLKELCGYAQEKNIVLGIENRFYYREIPSPEEFEIIFNQWKNDSISYWHDVGHSYILEKLGFMEEGSLLKKYGQRLCGVHLHNVKNLIDHQAPIEGDFDFNRLKPFVRSNILKIIEAHGHASASAIKKSLVYLEGMFHD